MNRCQMRWRIKPPSATTEQAPGSEPCLGMEQANRLAWKGNMQNPDGKQRSSPLPLSGLKKLNEQQIRQIDLALDAVGDYGEVHLIVRHGQLTYINRVESHRAWDSYGQDEPDS